MKLTRILILAMVVTLAFTGCTRRNNGNNTSTPSVVSSLPDVVSEIEDGIEDFVSDVEDGISDLEDDMDVSRDEEDRESSEASRLEDEESKLDDEVSEEESAAAMSTDFTEIGALDATKYEWGSGGPTDDRGRPEGAALYQEKYKQYDAYFVTPAAGERVYLTFDEGYENGYTASILDTLKEKDAKAVFFITYDYAKSEPELVKRMVDEGHVLGNHSTKHLSFPEMSLEDAGKDITDLHNYVKAQYGYEMWLFRPPMGHFSEQTLALAQSLGYKTIFWSFAYRDWEVDNQPLTIDAMNTITGKCHPGAIYLLHAVSKTNAEVLGDAIDHIRGEGYTISSWNIY